ncbi:SPOR domain-containing protein [Flavihumibacter rivuli]|uniref:SPOR domain-containing protein n=1 Tax=Flavihumibacter rivuli TaxID=2838156 RepID=UPI001BDF0D0B|nr:SPOR domain-containing protein [Flavihumibacter rivuli]ULQ56624.1 SPOR domain-containing protein [Flavihumibacter rivuli]
MKQILSLVLLLLVKAGFGQSDSLVVYKDPRIDQLVRKQAEINEFTTREARRNVSGFRIQVINTTDRNAAISAKTRVYKLFPELKAYLMYQSPYFRLRVGNFKTRKEAEEYQRQLAREFKNNVYIVNDVIEVDPTDSLMQEQ